MKSVKRGFAAILACVFLIVSFGILPAFAAEEEHVLFSADFSSVAEGETPAKGTGNDQWSNILTNADKKLFVRGEKDGDNTVLAFGCEESGQRGGPRIAKSVALTGLSSVMVSFRVKAEDTKLDVQLMRDEGGKSYTTALWSDITDGWAEVQIEIDLKKKTLKQTVNGKTVGEKEIHSINDYSTTQFRFTPTPEPGQSVYIDDVFITT